MVPKRQRFAVMLTVLSSFYGDTCVREAERGKKGLHRRRRSCRIRVLRRFSSVVELPICNRMVVSSNLTTGLGRWAPNGAYLRFTIYKTPDGPV